MNEAPCGIPDGIVGLARFAAERANEHGIGVWRLGQTVTLASLAPSMERQLAPHKPDAFEDWDVG